MARETYSPPWASHVSGSFERAFDEEGKPEPTIVEISCSTCAGTHRVKCESGAPRQWIVMFAKSHLHRDPLAAKKEEKA